MSISMVSTFTFLGREYTVRMKDGHDARCVAQHDVYRESIHLGGPWTIANRTLANPSIHAGFKRGLRQAMRKLAQLTALDNPVTI